MKAFLRIKHPHASMNANAQHKKEQEASLNIRLAVWLTNHVGTMYAAYVFALIGIGSLIGIFTGNLFLGLLFGSISSYFLQLVLLPVIMVAQNVQARHSEIQADETYKTSINTYHDIEQMQAHLDMQDQHILQILTAMQELTGKKRAV